MFNIERSTLLLFLLLLITIGCIGLSKILNGNTKLYIWNTSNHPFSVEYFADENGHWDKVEDVIPSHKLAATALSKNHLMQPANFNVRVGTNLNDTYCSTNLHMNSLNSKVALTKQSGNCATLKFNADALTLVIEPAKTK